eukprot:TRINITY_DN557_c0_g2_i3.p1 TRINITY_DN557_c0_g2~~TRINITY_DN557_c0_g2_i3.p1  ORF type:complete len:458 (+),score=63.96 TRINITY_DN557_c0_g2_i3:74-1447(+)
MESNDNQDATDVLEESFFDGLGQHETKLKFKGKELLQILNNIHYLSDSILHEEALLKRSQQDNKPLSEQYCVLFRDRLQVFKNKDKKDLKYTVFLKGVKVDFLNIEDDPEFQDEEYKYLIIFTYSKNYLIYHCKSQPNYEKWQKYLKKSCILQNYGKYYVNKKVIGKGNFAKVILADRLIDNQKFAIKTFDKRKLMQQSIEKKTAIANEIHLMQQIQHPNIITLNEVYEGENHIYLVMDLLTGGELFDRIVKKGNYTEKEACIIITKILNALSYLHSIGIMHRDLKPENLILRDENCFEIVIADFGLASYKTKNLLFKRCGTPGYVAPEILEDGEYDEKVDIFSAGVIFYILLTGCSPFYGKTYDEILQLNKKCNINYNFKEINFSFTEKVVNLLKQMLEKNASKRISASQALSHPALLPFIQQDIMPTPPQKVHTTKKNLEQHILMQKNIGNIIKA